MKKCYPFSHVGGLFLILIFFANLTQAQDPIFSQYFANRMYLNPAMTGFERGITVNINRRDQWRKIARKASKFVTQAVGLEMEVPCLQSSFGLTYMDNVEGEGFLRWQSAGLAYAWRTRPENFDDDFELSLGMKGNYNWRSINWDNFVFSDQLDAIYGNIGPTQLPINMSSNIYGSFFDLNTGFAFTGRISKEDRFTLGGALNHWLRIDNSLLDDTLATRATIHFTYVKDLNFGAKQKYHFSPMAKWDYQKSSRNKGVLAYNSLTYGFGISSQQAPGVWGGLWLQHRGFPNGRNTNSLVVLLGYEFRNQVNKNQTYRIGLSYDYNFSGIQSDGNGTFELSIAMNFAEGDILGCSGLGNRRNSRKCPKF